MRGLGKRSAEVAGVRNQSASTKRRKCWADILTAKALQNGIETDAHRISQREKQISYGKNTLAYDAFVGAITRNERTREHPCTPEVKQKCSKRAFDGQVRKWRRMLHSFKEALDESKENDERAVEASQAAKIASGQPAGDQLDPRQMGLASAEESRTENYIAADEAELSDWEKEDWDDDIQLDDEGNPIEVSPATTATTAGLSTDNEMERAEAERSPPVEAKTIFDKF